MPCFSASNVRFVTAGGRQSIEKKDRPRTSIRSIHFADEFPPNSRNGDVTRFLKKQCNDYIRTRINMRHKKNSFCPPNTFVTQKTLSTKELQRIQDAAKLVSLEDRLDELMKREQETKRLDAESEVIRGRFREIDDARKKILEAGEVKEEQAGENEKLQVLERAFIAKHESEEDVKQANRIILNAKCHAVRDAQIQEKTEFENEQKKADRRMELNMLEITRKALDEIDDKEEKQRVVKQKYAADIRQQLEERANLRFLEAERIEEEAQMMKAAYDAMKRDEELNKRLARERRVKFREELQRITAMSNEFKRVLCEQEKEADMRVAAYMREKEARQRQLAIEKKAARAEYERKQQRIYALAEKVLEAHSQRDEMAYIKEQEKIEREYRRKQKEAVLRKKEIMKELNEARERQLAETKLRQALHIARSEQEFNTLIENLKKEEEKQRKLDEERARQRVCYRKEIVRQMTDKELERRRIADLEKAQSIAWRETERQRDANIRMVINAKVNAMREACLPERYIRDVQRQLNKIATMRVPVEEDTKPKREGLRLA